MGEPAQHHSINYIEFEAADIPRVRRFYSEMFGWSFQEFGADYISFNRASAGIDGGFRKCDGTVEPETGAPLVVLYSRNLGATESAIVAAGGHILVPTFEFLGGRRFHFRDTEGNVLAVWSE